ncbi:MAG TPA: peptide chain release factor N(5)-glutamine methyltransferase [Arcobacter sp.]|jgi:release factor glutamine methyltransferase|nr:peptide chain release factor N(5)-glutamine methyltransferase [Arcobacter sp.]
MTYRQIVKKLSSLLKEITHIPQKEVEILLLSIIKQNNIWLHMNYNEECMCEQELEKLVKKRATDYPLEYLTQRATFFGEQFYVTKNVLIPRPETELLVEKAIEILQGEEKPLKIIEIGIGSGIISTIIAKELDDVKIIAVDVNDDAINLAKRNIKYHQVDSKIEVLKSNLFENIKEMRIDVVISNPPYIKNDFKLPKNVTYEPSNALFGGDKGDELLKQIIDETYKRKIKYLFCEMGYDQKQPLEKYLSKFDTKFVTFYKDYSDFDRGFLVEFTYD